MIEFMLPVQLGAMTFDGTWLILLGILAVMGIVYKNRENLSLTSAQYNKNENENETTNIQYEENEVEVSDINEVNMEERDKKKIDETDEVLNKETEYEFLFN